jgi:muconate cycloisomerase
MQIARITTRPLFLPYRVPFHWAQGVIEGAEVVLVEIETDTDVIGYGETIGGPSGRAIKALVDTAAARMIGRDPFDHRALWAEAYTALFRAQAVCSAPRFGGQVLAGLEMALWDVMGKVTGRPVHQLLGGARHQRIGYHGFAMGDTAAAVAADAADLQARGFGIIYIKAGFGGGQDLARVAAVREAIGPQARLRLDPNEAWSPLEARRMIAALEPFGIEFIEQPCNAESISALGQIRAGSPIAIAADQLVFTPHEAFEICARRAADLIVIGPHETGGLARMADVARIAEAAGLTICLHGLYETGITTCAAHQLAAACANIDDGNQHMLRFLEFDIVSAPDLTPQAGWLDVIRRPGLGFDLDPDKVGEAEARFDARSPI